MEAPGYRKQFTACHRTVDVAFIFLNKNAPVRCDCGLYQQWPLLHFCEAEQTDVVHVKHSVVRIPHRDKKLNPEQFMYVDYTQQAYAFHNIPFVTINAFHNLNGGGGGVGMRCRSGLR